LERNQPNRPCRGGERHADVEGAKYPNATKSLESESDKLMTHFAFPAEHLLHLSTTNPIESTFATVKLRQRVTKGAGSRSAGLAMAYRLLLLAEQSWRA